MKYSILMPYCRRESLKSTLLSFVHHYSERKDFEVLIIEDIKNFEKEEDHKFLLSMIEPFKDTLTINIVKDDLHCYNPSRRFNLGYKASKGQYLIITNPEIFHEVNILKGLDEEFSKAPDDYIVCSCKAVAYAKQSFDTFEEHSQGTPLQWIQHSISLNRLFHFCSAISRSNYAKVGGFDEKYCAGIAYDDNCFVERVIINGITIRPIDALSTIHIEHNRDYQDYNKELWRSNGELFTQQRYTNDFFEKYV